MRQTSTYKGMGDSRIVRVAVTPEADFRLVTNAVHVSIDDQTIEDLLPGVGTFDPNADIASHANVHRRRRLDFFAEFQREPLPHGSVHGFLNLVLGSQGHDFLGELLRLAEPGRTDDGLDHGNRARRHRQGAKA